MSQQSQDDERAAMETATGIATEAVVSIKTVQSLGKHAVITGGDTISEFSGVIYVS